MSEIVFFLEERSAEALLKIIIPKILNPVPTCRYIVFEGKQDLDKRLTNRMRGYLVPNARFVVLRDQDSGDCRVIKHSLRAKCNDALRPEALIRIACRELESWYLADMLAIEKGLRVSGLTRCKDKRGFRNPDLIQSPARELARLVKTYQKIAGARSIAPYMNLENTASQSFRQFVDGIRRLAQPNV